MFKKLFNFKLQKYSIYLFCHLITFTASKHHSQAFAALTYWNTYKLHKFDGNSYVKKTRTQKYLGSLKGKCHHQAYI